MQSNYRTPDAPAQAAQDLAHHLELFLSPLLIWLERRLDQRLVRTFLATIATIVEFRDRVNALLLTELGPYLAPSPPAGVKRLSNLLRSPRWSASLIGDFLWWEASLFVRQLNAQHEDCLALWDDSVLEKPESRALEGLCAVRSSKAKRLTRLKHGYYQPPRGQVFVPGRHWLGVVLAGLSGVPKLANLSWWTTRGQDATDQRTEANKLLAAVAKRWGKQVVHIFDRGYAGQPWLRQLCNYHLRFVLRWPKRYHLQDLSCWQAPAWQLVRGKRSWQRRELWDSHQHCYRQTGVVASEVRHPQLPYPLWLVVSRPGRGREPWYLLTNEPVHNAEDAWRIVLCYRRRWQIEMNWRYLKSELGLQSPRLQKWANQEKLLLMASLAYAYLLSLMDSSLELMREWLLEKYCAWRGKRSRAVAAPLYRLRAALSKLWRDHHPQLDLFRALNSG